MTHTMYVVADHGLSNADATSTMLHCVEGVVRVMSQTDFSFSLTKAENPFPDVLRISNKGQLCLKSWLIFISEHSFTVYVVQILEKEK